MRIPEPKPKQPFKARLLALLCGMLFAALAVAGVWLALPAQGQADQQTDYGYVYSGAKSSSPSFMSGAVNDDTLIVLGSSEFSTPPSIVPQMPVNVFGAHNYGMSLMCVGEAYDQCLWDAMALGALAKQGIPGNKVAVIVGLGQFTNGGLDSQTFSVRYSQTLWSEFCLNDQLSEESRTYVARRLGELGIEDMKVRAGLRETPIDIVNDTVLSVIDDLRLRQKLTEVRSQGIARSSDDVQAPDFVSLRAEALATAQERSTNNDWGIDDTFWTSSLEPVLDRVKDSRTDETYTDTPEYDDLEVFLDVCDECGIQPLVIVQPVLGPYYDHIGISADTRNAAYQRIRDIVAGHASAKLADFSNREYEPYFLYDIVHFGWTGWTDAEEALYRFWTEGVA